MRQYNARTFARKVFIEMETRLIDDRTISSRKRIIRQTIDYLWCEKWCAILLRAFIKGLFLIWKVDKKDFHEKLTRWPRFQRPIECSIEWLGIFKFHSKYLLIRANICFETLKFENTNIWRWYLKYQCFKYQCFSKIRQNTNICRLIFENTNIWNFIGVDVIYSTPSYTCSLSAPLSTSHLVFSLCFLFPFFFGCHFRHWLSSSFFRTTYE